MSGGSASGRSCISRRETPRISECQAGNDRPSLAVLMAHVQGPLKTHFAIPTVTLGCWLDVYEREQFKGRLRRLLGPSLYSNIRTSSQNWGIEIGSLIIGPSAFVLCFAQRRADQAIWLPPNTRLDRLTAIAGEIDFDSIRVSDRPPTKPESHADHPLATTHHR
jgi:hypothetical protein